MTRGHGAALIEQQAEQAHQRVEDERERVELAQQERATLLARIAHPERAEASLPWTPRVPATAGRCQGCGRTFTATWSRQGHAVEAATNGRARCLNWAMGLPA